jgi:MoaA/NifB/PqqE/SkfB family radical SAM enzyme
MMNTFRTMAKTCLYKAAYFLNTPFVRPDTLQISLTSRCNLRCRMCSVDKYATREDEEMSVEETCKIISAANRDFGIKKLVLTGGEPLLLGNKIVEVTAYAKGQGLDVIFTTNGFFLKEQAEALAEAGVAHFHVSLDGLKDTHNDLRQHQESFDKATEGIRILAGMRRRLGARYSIGVGTVIVKNNIRELYDLYRFADTLDVDIFDLLPYLSDNTDFSNTREASLWPDENDVRCFLDMYLRMVSARTRRIKVNTFLDPDLLAKYYRRTMQKGDWQCMAGYKNIFITMSDPKKRGRFEPCIFMCKAHLPVREQNHDLKRMWHSQEARAARLKIRCCDAYCYQICFSLPSFWKFSRTRQAGSP